MKPLGKIELSNLVALAVVAGGIWAVILFSRPVLDNLDVKSALAEAVNQRGYSEDQLKQFLLTRLNGSPGANQHVGTHFELDDTGHPIEVPGLGLDEDNIEVDRNTVTGRQTITILYDRTVQLSPLHRQVQLHFSPSKEGEIR